MTWIALHTDALRSSIRFDLDAAERGVFYDLLLVAGESRTPGIIQQAEGIPYPTDWLAGHLRVSEELLKVTIKKCVKEGRIQNSGGILTITNWNRYQLKYLQRKEEKKDLEA